MACATRWIPAPTGAERGKSRSATFHIRDDDAYALDGGQGRADVKPAMDRRLVPQRPLLEQLPAPARRITGVTVLTLTLWLASFLALLR